MPEDVLLLIEVDSTFAGIMKPMRHARMNGYSEDLRRG